MSTLFDSSYERRKLPLLSPLLDQQQALYAPEEMAACIVIALGVFMMLQPFALVLFTYSFATTLAGVLMFTIVSKFPA